MGKDFYSLIVRLWVHWVRWRECFSYTREIE